MKGGQGVRSGTDPPLLGLALLGGWLIWGILIPNRDRLVGTLETLAAFGYRQGHGVTRLSLDPADLAARCYVVNLWRRSAW